MRLFAAYLRRPVNDDDPRDDPFYSQGSFGTTGCHDDNLLNPNTCPVSNGDRIGFVQPGRQGPRIVYISPPVTVHRGRPVELSWVPSKALKYEHALPMTVQL